MNTYLLIDRILLGLEGYSPPFADPPAWYSPLFREVDPCHSPAILDVSKACESDDLITLLEIYNALPRHPHASFIDCELEADKLVRHLLRFKFLLDPEGKRLSVRLADSIAMSVLFPILNEQQRLTMLKPIARWGVHDRSGQLRQFFKPPGKCEEDKIPFTLSVNQIAEVDRLTAPFVLIAQLKSKRGVLPYDVQPQINWAEEVLAIASGENKLSEARIVVLADAVFRTRGALLTHQALPSLVADGKSDHFYRRLREMAAHFL